MRRIWILSVLSYGFVVGFSAGYLMTEGPLVTVRNLGLVAQLGWDNLCLRQQVAELAEERDNLRTENHDLDRHNTAVEGERAELRLALRAQVIENVVITARFMRLQGAVGVSSSWCQGEIFYHSTPVSASLVLYDQRDLADPSWSPQPLILRFPEPARIMPAAPK